MNYFKKVQINSINKVNINFIFSLIPGILFSVYKVNNTVQ